MGKHSDYNKGTEGYGFTLGDAVSSRVKDDNSFMVGRDEPLSPIFMALDGRLSHFNPDTFKHPPANRRDTIKDRDWDEDEMEAANKRLARLREENMRNLEKIRQQAKEAGKAGYTTHAAYMSGDVSLRYAKAFASPRPNGAASGANVVPLPWRTRPRPSAAVGGSGSVTARERSHVALPALRAPRLTQATQNGGAAGGAREGGAGGAGIDFTHSFDLLMRTLAAVPQRKLPPEATGGAVTARERLKPPLHPPAVLTPRRPDVYPSYLASDSDTVTSRPAHIAAPAPVSQPAAAADTGPRPADGYLHAPVTGPRLSESSPGPGPAHPPAAMVGPRTPSGPRLRKRPAGGPLPDGGAHLSESPPAAAQAPATSFGHAAEWSIAAVPPGGGNNAVDSDAAVTDRGGDEGGRGRYDTAGLGEYSRVPAADEVTAGMGARQRPPAAATRDEYETEGGVSRAGGAGRHMEGFASAVPGEASAAPGAGESAAGLEPVPPAAGRVTKPFRFPRR